MNIKINNNNKIAIWAITKSGYQHGFNLARNIDDSVLFISEDLVKSLNGLKAIDISFCNNPRVFSRLSESIKDVFKDFDGHIFIFSTEIAVTIIAPLINSKIEDSAVVVLDDRATNAISLLSGHFYRANELTKKVSLITKAKSVITTGTDTPTETAVGIVAKDDKGNIINKDVLKE